jgi:DNA-directed RNA polymerase subunit E'/Rpb7
MYHTVYLDERIALTPAEINSLTTADSVREILITKLKEKHEGKCNTNGYVRPGSVDLLGRSMGIAENGRFTGNLLYDCKMKCEVLFPTGGSEMVARVVKVNKMGAYAQFDEAIRILLPRDLHVKNKEFDAIREGDDVRVRLERSRFQANDPFIMAVGTMTSESATATATATAESS